MDVTIDIMDVTIARLSYPKAVSKPALNQICTVVPLPGMSKLGNCLGIGSGYRKRLIDRHQL
jgi:hypothetical protein